MNWGERWDLVWIFIFEEDIKWASFDGFVATQKVGAGILAKIQNIFNQTSNTTFYFKLERGEPDNSLVETRSGTPNEGSGGRGGPRAGGSGRRQEDRGREQKPNGEQEEERRRRAREICDLIV